MGNTEYDKYGLIEKCQKDLLSLRLPLEDFPTTGNRILEVVKCLEALKVGMKDEEIHPDGPSYEYHGAGTDEATENTSQEVHETWTNR